MRSCASSWGEKVESTAYEASFRVMTDWGCRPTVVGSLFGDYMFDSDLLSCVSFVAPLHGCSFAWTKNEGLAPSCGSIVSNDGCSLPARLISRNSLDLVSRPDVWQVGDRSFTRFTAQELPGSCEETFDRAILHVAAKPNNIRWFSAEEHYHSVFTHIRVR